MNFYNFNEVQIIKVCDNLFEKEKEREEKENFEKLLDHETIKNKCAVFSFELLI